VTIEWEEEGEKDTRDGDRTAVVGVGTDNESVWIEAKEKKLDTVGKVRGLVAAGSTRREVRVDVSAGVLGWETIEKGNSVSLNVTCLEM
jgi:hypothetical protein